jgi:photosystem II stability/assembly factor-like uncharacterized protein
MHDSPGGGLFRLAGGGEEWTQVSSEILKFGKPFKLIAVPAFRRRLYAATADSILVSRDAGETWTRLIETKPAPSLADLFSPPEKASRIVAAAGPRLLVSRDSARTWKRRYVPGLPAIRKLFPLDPPWTAAISGENVFLSSDYGDTWRACAPIPGVVAIHGVVALSGGRMLAATSGGLWLSEDLGGSWQPTRGPLGGSTIQAICRHPLEPSLAFAAYYRHIYMSRDSGNSWTLISPEAPQVGSVKQLVVVPGTPDRLFVLTSQEGVFVWPLDEPAERQAGVPGLPPNF